MLQLLNEECSICKTSINVIHENGYHLPSHSAKLGYLPLKKRKVFALSD